MAITSTRPAPPKTVAIKPGERITVVSPPAERPAAVLNRRWLLAWIADERRRLSEIYAGPCGLDRRTKILGSKEILSKLRRLLMSSQFRSGKR